MSRARQTIQQHVFIPKSHKAFSKLCEIIEISYLREGGVLATAVLCSVEEMRDFCLQVCQGREALPWLYPGLVLHRVEHWERKREQQRVCHWRGRGSYSCFTR